MVKGLAARPGWFDVLRLGLPGRVAVDREGSMIEFPESRDRQGRHVPEARPDSPKGAAKVTRTWKIQSVLLLFPLMLSGGFFAAAQPAAPESTPVISDAAATSTDVEITQEMISRADEIVSRLGSSCYDPRCSDAIREFKIAAALSREALASAPPTANGNQRIRRQLMDEALTLMRRFSPAQRELATRVDAGVKERAHAQAFSPMATTDPVACQKACNQTYATGQNICSSLNSLGSSTVIAGSVIALGATGVCAILASWGVPGADSSLCPVIVVAASIPGCYALNYLAAGSCLLNCSPPGIITCGHH